MQTPTLSVLTAQPSTEGTLAHRCSRRPFRRARETGLPTISMDSNSGGDTREPVTAGRRRSRWTDRVPGVYSRGAVVPGRARR